MTKKIAAHVRTKHLRGNQFVVDAPTVEELPRSSDSRSCTHCGLAPLCLLCERDHQCQAINSSGVLGGNSRTLTAGTDLITSMGNTAGEVARAGINISDLAVHISRSSMSLPAEAWRKWDFQLQIWGSSTFVGACTSQSSGQTQFGKWRNLMWARGGRHPVGASNHSDAGFELAREIRHVHGAFAPWMVAPHVWRASAWVPLLEDMGMALLQLVARSFTAVVGLSRLDDGTQGGGGRWSETLVGCVVTCPSHICAPHPDQTICELLRSSSHLARHRPIMPCQSARRVSLSVYRVFTQPGPETQTLIQSRHYDYSYYVHLKTFRPHQMFGQLWGGLVVLANLPHEVHYD